MEKPGETPNEVDRLTWRELLATGRRSLALCRETSSTSFTILVASTVLASFLPAALAATAGLVVNEVEGMLRTEDTDVARLVPWLLIFAGVTLLSGFIQSIRTYCQNVLSADMDLVLSKRVLEHRVSLDLGFFERPQNHDLIQRGSGLRRRLAPAESSLGVVRDLRELLF